MILEIQEYCEDDKSFAGDTFIEIKCFWEDSNGDLHYVEVTGEKYEEIERDIEYDQIVSVYFAGNIKSPIRKYISYAGEKWEEIYE